MLDEPTLYAVLRDRREWPDCTLSSLQADADGYLSLLQIPGPEDGVAIELAQPYDVEASGLAIGPCRQLAIADTASNRVEVRDGACSAVFLLPSDPAVGNALGVFDAPRGLWIDEQTLWVADSGNGRLQGFLLPSLELFAVIESGLQQPVAVARDRQRRLYVLDRGLKAVRRFDDRGDPDTAFDAEIAAETAVPGRLPAPFDPRFIALGEDGTLYVSDDASNLSLRFDDAGAWRDPLPAAGTQPRALAISGRLLYVADASSGAIAVQDCDSGEVLSWVSGYRGPVAALAVDEGGNLLVKPGDEPKFHRFANGKARAASGMVTAGPLDAGEKQAWFRALANVEIPAGAAVAFDVFQSDSDTIAPTAADWLRMPAFDALLEGIVAPAIPSFLRRYLWLRVSLHGAPDGASPTLRQVQAETPREDYLDYLPAAYRKADAPTGFLSRLLALTRAEAGGFESRIDDIARLFGRNFAPTEALDWLAGWLAFDFPIRVTADEKRALFARIVALLDRRGTPESLRALIRLQTGVDAEIREDFRDRRIWILDDELGSRLGFDTGLPAIEPPGLVLPDPPLSPESDYPECAPTIGSATVGEIAPLGAHEWARCLYTETSYLFSVHVPVDQARQTGILDAIADVLDREKPAHTEYRICTIDATMRAGLQATVGIDAIVGDQPRGSSLGGTVLNASFRLGGPPDSGGRLGLQTRVGQTSVGQETSP